MSTSKQKFYTKMNELASAVQTLTGQSGPIDLNNIVTDASLFSENIDGDIQEYTDLNEELREVINSLPNASGGSSSQPVLQTKTATPTTSQQNIVPDSGYDGLSKVTVEAIPSTYVQPKLTKGAATITPGTTNQTISAGTYCAGAQVIKGDANLISANIKSGVSIFGVGGSYKGEGGGSGSSIEGIQLSDDIVSTAAGYIGYTYVAPDGGVGSVFQSLSYFPSTKKYHYSFNSDMLPFGSHIIVITDGSVSLPLFGPSDGEIIDITPDPLGGFRVYSVQSPNMFE